MKRQVAPGAAEAIHVARARGVRTDEGPRATDSMNEKTA